MKKKILFSLLILAMFIPFVSVKAEDDTFGIDVLTTASEPENTSAFVADDDISYDRNIDGILFAAGNNLNITGSSEYGFYAGNVLNVKGIVEKDLFVAGNSIIIGDTATIGRDVFIAGNTVNIRTDIKGKLKVFASAVDIKNITIDGDVYIDGGTITFDNVTINGKLKYNEDATVTGIDSIIATNIEKFESGVEYLEPTFKDIFESKMISALSLLLIAIIINALFPNLYKKSRKELSASRVFKNIGWGLVFLIALPIASIFLLISVIGSGLGLIALGVYALCLGVAVLPAMALIGNLILTKLFNRKDNFYWAIIMGVLLVSFISLIPVIGGFVNFLVMMFGLGLIFELMFKKSVTKIKK